jgi:asparagine synthase (glutamine-hydrolysing)
MCGICGIISGRDGVSPDRAELARMMEAIRHRGPDADGLHVDGRCALGNRRLSIIDLAGGDQPIANEDRTVWIVYNGEVFNYRELREELQARGHRFATAGDTEVIVHLYEEHGDECVRHLRGMYAFALWDARRGRALLARDRLGIKPLYYAEQDGGLVFASELKGLLPALRGPRELDPEAVEEYITLGYVPSPHAILRGVRKLPPAHVLAWTAGGTTLRRYWDVRYGGAGRMSLPEAAAQLRERLADAVRAWTISDVPVGAFLSGGVDSSLVTALMCRHAGDRVRTFSVGFDDPRYDERAYAQQMVQRYGTVHEEIRLDAAALDGLPRLAWFMDEPLADDSAVPMYAVSELAGRRVKVVLSGDGGDELFGGYTWTVRDQVRRWAGWVPAPLRRPLAHLGLNGGADLAGPGWGARLRRGLGDAMATLEDGYIRRTTVGAAFKSALYHPSLRERLGAYEGAAPARGRLGGAAVADARERMLYADQTLYLPDDILFKVDRMSMAHSLEARTPLLDHPLVEFAATLPYDFKVRGLVSKYILKEAIRDLVPAALLRQRKHGFSMPVGRWLRTRGAAAARGMLTGPAAERRRLWAAPFVRWLLDEHTAGRRDFGRRLWSLLVLEAWARLYLDAGAVQTPPARAADLV